MGRIYTQAQAYGVLRASLATKGTNQYQTIQQSIPSRMLVPRLLDYVAPTTTEKNASGPSKLRREPGRYPSSTKVRSISWMLRLQLSTALALKFVYALSSTLTLTTLVC
jgi:hypothetical protein